MMAEPNPDLFLDAVLGFQKTAALKAVLAFEVFTAVEAESGDLDRMAARTGAAVRGIRMLCDYLTVQGFLTKNRGRYGLTHSTKECWPFSTSLRNFIKARPVWHR